MGFGFPAAIGAAIGAPKTPTVLVTGDGGFQMNMQEMAMAMNLEVPVVVCLFNNTHLGMVRQMQTLFFGKRYEITDLSSESGQYYPDFMEWAKSYNALGIRVDKIEDIVPALKKARSNKKGPTIVEFNVSPDELVLPMVKGGTALSEMILK